MMIQQGVSVGDIGGTSSSSHDPAEGAGMTIGKIMDWIEARLDVIKSREEEEDKDEEKEKEKEKEHDSAWQSPPPCRPPSVPCAAFTLSPTLMPTPTPNPSIHSFLINDISAGAKRRHAVMMMLDSASATVAIANLLQSGTSHAHPPLSPCSNVPGHHAGASGTRRRTRSSRGAHQLQHPQSINVSQSAEVMDVEEDGGGRERKRVARR
jgi:hypothetical protein